MEYFKQFKTIKYGTYNCTDITQRVRLRDSVLGNPYVFYPYSLKDHQRPDTVSDQYYNDPNLSWMIYFGNKVIDPYYGWHLDHNAWNEYITVKYGSIDLADAEIKFYRNNWYADDRTITTSQYNALVGSQRKYWNPVFNGGRTVIGYVRKQENWTVNTNRIYRVSIDVDDDETFSVGERINFYSNLTSTISMGSAIVDLCNTSVLFFKHISSNSALTFEFIRPSEIDAEPTDLYESAEVGDLVATAIVSDYEPVLIVTGEANNTIVVTSDPNLIKQNISIEDEAYWSPVTALEWEEEINESLRDINLLDRGLTLQATEEMASLLKK